MTRQHSMQSLVQQYLSERRSLGFALIVPGTQLMSFARFADRVGHRGPLTRQIMIDWAQGQTKRATYLTWARRLQRIIPFARYRAFWRKCRIRHFRHTFICRRVKLWHEQSADIDNAMVALSTYVGT